MATDRKGRNVPYYTLEEISERITDGDVIFTRDARDGAAHAFGWDTDDMLEALSKLESKHFFKTENAYWDKSIAFDYYKARNLMGENVYIHFFIDDKSSKPKLVVNSFKGI